MKSINRMPRLVDEWSTRIEALERLMETAPEWAWLWEIRLRVLRFLRSRYGSTETARRLPTPPASFWIDPRPDSAHVDNSARPSQWMSQQEMREILDDIHEIATSSSPDEADVS